MCLSPPVSGDNKDPAEERLEAAVTIVKKAYSEVPSFDAIIEALLRVPLEKLNETCSLRPGLPVEPMLAKPTKSLQEVLKRLSGQSFTCEFKYDGERAQVHMADDGVTKVGIIIVTDLIVLFVRYCIFHAQSSIILSSCVMYHCRYFRAIFWIHHKSTQKFHPM